MLMRFLIIRLSSIGDIVHALPAASALARTYPESQVHWVVESRYAVLLKGNPLVHRTIPLNTLSWRKTLASVATLKEISRGIKAVREVEYDAAVDFQGLCKSAMIARLSRSHQRLGFSRQWLREPAAGILYGESVTPTGRRHVIEINFAVVERLGVRTLQTDQWEFPLPRTESDDAYVEMQLASLEARDFMVINPGAGWQSKRWAPAQYAELIRCLAPEFSGEILLTGSPAEEGMIREIVKLSGSARAHYFQSALIQLIALLRRARLFLGGDTGPMHLAAALSTPVVALFGSTDFSNTPERNGPFSSDDIIVSPPTPATMPAGDHYIQGITTGAVLKAIRERLARAHG